MTYMKLSKNGLQMIKNFEGLILVASNKLDGVWTVGYGCTVGVKPYQRITEKVAEEMLIRELEKHETYVNKYVNQLNLNQNQFDALVSFSYNCGVGNLKKLVADKNGKATRDKKTIAKKMILYNKCNGKVMRGLVNRRKKEYELFCSKDLTTVEKSNAIKKTPNVNNNMTLVEICKILYGKSDFNFRKELYKNCTGSELYIGSLRQNLKLKKYLLGMR